MAIYEKKLELVVLQASSFCNIDCKYCYLPDRKITSLMSDAVLEESIKKILRSSLLSNEITFLWHSGEPLAVGIPFYQKALNLINKHNINNKKIINAIQTNGMLIDQEWCDFFVKNNFQVGLSLDGPEFLHDENRVTRNGKGTFHKVMKGTALLKKNNIKLAAICVLSRKTLDYPKELFDFFFENEFSRLSLVLEEIIGENKESSLNENMSYVSNEIKQKYSEFMKVLFKLWVPAKDKIHIREFAELCNLVVKNKEDPIFEPKPQEVMPFKIITLQKNGDISTFCPELAGGTKDNKAVFNIGNILDISELEDVTKNEKFLKMENSIARGIDNCRNGCDYFKLCGGRSPAIKMYENNSFESTSTKHCLLHRQVLADTVITELKTLSNTMLASS
jgi:uncharacterized protein